MFMQKMLWTWLSPVVAFPSLELPPPSMAIKSVRGGSWWAAICAHDQPFMLIHGSYLSLTVLNTINTDKNCYQHQFHLRIAPRSNTRKLYCTQISKLRHRKVPIFGYKLDGNWAWDRFVLAAAQAEATIRDQVITVEYWERTTDVTKVC